MLAVSHGHHKTPETGQAVSMGKVKGGKRWRERMIMDLRKWRERRGDCSWIAVQTG